MRANDLYIMASAASTYDERLRVVDAFEEYKFYFSKAHFLFLIQESLAVSYTHLTLPTKRIV